MKKPKIHKGKKEDCPRCAGQFKGLEETFRLLAKEK